MHFWDYILLNNTLRAWAIALLVGAGIVVLLLLVRRVLVGRLQRIAERRPALNVYHLVYRLIRQTKTTFLVVFTVSLILGIMLKLPLRWVSTLEKLAIAVLILQIGFWLTAATDYSIARRVAGGAPDQPARATTLNALRLVLVMLIWVAVLLLILENSGVRVTTLIASLGITGIAVGLAVQNILGDLFASLSIAIDQPFVIGDFITVGEFSGSVEHVGLKSTRLRSLSGEQLIFSNSDLLSSRIRNFKRMNRRRVAFFLNAPFSTPPEKAELVPAMVREVVEQHELVTFDRAHLKELGVSGLVFEIVYFLESSDYNLFMDIQQQVNLEIMRRFAAEGITFAYPTQTLQIAGDGLAFNGGQYSKNE